MATLITHYSCVQADPAQTTVNFIPAAKVSRRLPLKAFLFITAMILINLCFSNAAFASKKRVTAVSYGSQTGTAYSGTATSVTYNLTLTEAGTATPALDNLSLTWAGGTPTGVTYTFSSLTETPITNTTFTPSGIISSNITLTITTTSATPAGSNAFTIVTTDTNGGGGPYTSSGLTLLVTGFIYPTSSYTGYAGNTITPGVPITYGAAPLSFSGTLPAGLTLNTSNGQISGTPTTPSGATNYTITANYSLGATVTTVLNITILAQTISYTPSTFTYYAGNTIATQTPTYTSTPNNFSSTALPAGLTFSTSTGQISGTPTTPTASAVYTITANYNGGVTATTMVTIAVLAPTISYTGSPFTFISGAAISTLTPTYTGSPTSFSGTLPAGLTLNTTSGQISGAPTAASAAAANFTITANYAGGVTATTIINITVNPKLPAISYTTPQTYTQNVAITTLSPTSTGGAVATYTVSSLPAGLTINASTGAITGTPTAGSAAANYTVTATNVTGSATATINITVIIAAPTSSAVTQCGAGAVLTASDVSSAGGNYNWYSVSTGGVAFQSSASTTFSAVCTATYYVSYTYGGIESARTAVTATINPIVSAPYSGAYFSYPFNGNTNDVSSYQNAGSNNGASLTTDRYGASNAAYSFNGSSNYITDPFLDNNPSIYTVSIWFNTTTTTGGSLIGLESGNYDDRILYMSNSGQVYWGLYPGSVQTINTPASYNDGNWHHAVVTVSSSGSTLYLDGIAQATSASMTTGNGTNGYWQMGYSLISGWTNAPTSNYFSGKLDDIAVYHRALSSAEIASSNDLNQIYSGIATACTALAFNAPTITGATYTWKDPNNNTQTGQSVTFPGAVAGNYTLTVTGGPGGCSSSVTITPTVYTSSSAAFNSLASVAVNTNTSISLFSPVASSTYSWNFGGGTSSSGTTGQGPFSVQWSSTGVKTITLTTTTSGGCVITTTQTITVTSTTYGNYTYSRTITLNNAVVGMSANVSQFPVLLSIQNNDLIITGTCNDKIQNPNGPNYDFAFFDSSTQSELYYQIESYNQTTGTLLVWVRIPTMYATTNNTLSFYYGAKVPSVTHNAAFSVNTWTADYQAVYHFSETSYSPTTADGTANGRTASLAGFSAGSYVANGKIGSCYTFGGVEDMEAAPTAPSSIITTSAWVNTSNNNSDEKIISNQSSSGNASGGYKLAVYFGSAEFEAVYNSDRSSTTPTEPTPLSNGTWYYVQGVYDGTTISTYVNGVQYKKYAVTNTSTFSNTLYIGIGEGKIYPFSGMIDEPRVSNIAKSSDWIKMEYADQNNPVAFTTVSTNATTVSTANGSSIPGEISYTWTGATSTDPTVTSNWNNTATATSALPPFDGSQSLFIPAGLSKYPVLTSSISMYGLNIANGASLNLNGFTLTVGCNIYNSSGGQILYGGNTASGLTFNGSLASQYYYGSTTAATGQTGNLTVNNTASGTVNISGGGLDVYGTLTMTSGNLAVGASPGALTLKSLAGQTANVAAIPTGLSITGNVTAERFVTGGATYNLGKWVYRNYRLMSSPVNEGVDAGGNYPYSLNYLGASTIISDCATTYAASNHGNPSLYLFNEKYTPSNVSYVSGNFIGVTDVTSTVASGTISTTDATNSTGKLYAGDGYMMYFRGNNINNLTGTPSKTSAPYVAPENVTFSTTGLLNQGTYSVVSWTGAAGLMYTTSNAGNVHVRGFNLVGNPYPSSIDWSTFSNSSSTAAIYGANVNPSVYIFDPITGNYDTYSATTHLATGKASNVIASGQGFFVQANAASPTLKFNESAKTSAQVSAANSLLGTPNSQGAYNSYLRLKLVTDSLNQNDMLIGFNSTSTPNFNGQEDAEFLSGLNQLQSIMSITKDSIKAAAKWLALPKGTAEDVVKLRVWAQTKGVYTIQRTDLKAIPAIYEIWLMDNLKKDSLDIRNNSSYAFDLDPADTTTFGNNRFTVVIRENQALAFHLLNFTATKATGGSALVWVTENEQNYTNFTVQRSTDGGNTFNVLGGQGSSAIGTYSFTDTNPANGANMYRVMIQDLNGTISYTNVITLTYGGATTAATASNGIVIYPNPAMNTINLSIQQNTQLPSIVHSTNSTLTLGSPATGTATAAYSITITNNIGYVMRTDATTTQSWQADVGNLLPGVYIIQVQDKNTKTLVGKGTFVKL